MTPQRIIGIVLLALGVILLVMGVNASNSFSDQISNVFTGRFTDNTTLLIVGGILSAIVGLSMLLFSARGKNA